MCPAAVEPEFTADALLAGYWMRKGRTVTPLHPPVAAQEQQQGGGAQAGEGEYVPKYENVTDHNGEIIGVRWVNADQRQVAGGSNG